MGVLDQEELGSSLFKILSKMEEMEKILNGEDPNSIKRCNKS
jgi:hypothetical protein